MISRRATLAGLLAGGVLTNSYTRQWLFGLSANAGEPKPLVISKVLTGEIRDGVRTYDLRVRTY